MEFEIAGPSTALAADCAPIIHALPHWFGIDAGIADYLEEIQRLETFLATSGDATLGFLTIKEHTPSAAEAYVMGVRPDCHRRGIGRALLAAATGHLRAQGKQFLTVKTLGPSRPDENYAKTRLFYEAMGFRPLEEFDGLWDPGNPCLLMVKVL